MEKEKNRQLSLDLNGNIYFTRLCRYNYSRGTDYEFRSVLCAVRFASHFCLVVLFGVRHEALDDKIYSPQICLQRIRQRC